MALIIGGAVILALILVGYKWAKMRAAPASGALLLGLFLIAWPLALGLLLGQRQKTIDGPPLSIDDI